MSSSDFFRKFRLLFEAKEHISPDGIKTNMDPNDDDYKINYGPGGLVAKDRKVRGVDVKTGSKKTDEERDPRTGSDKPAYRPAWPEHQNKNVEANKEKLKGRVSTPTDLDKAVSNARKVYANIKKEDVKETAERFAHEYAEMVLDEARNLKAKVDHSNDPDWECVLGAKGEYWRKKENPKGVSAKADAKLKARKDAIRKMGIVDRTGKPIKESAGTKRFKVLIKYKDPSGKGIASRTYSIPFCKDAGHAKDIAKHLAYEKGLEDVSVTRVTEVTP